MNTQHKFCSQCGSELPDSAKFCASCGLDLTQIGGAPTQAMGSADIMEELENLLKKTIGNDYEVEGPLGRGGMAAVFKAREIMLDRVVAIKVLPPELAFGSGMIERFKREAKTSAQLNHPNIIPIYRIGEAGRTLYFVMKYVEGQTLEEVMDQSGKLEPSVVGAIMQQMGSALSYAHRRGVIHRDIKPSNVMIDADGWAMIMDFGIAKASGSAKLTATGAALGTPFYMSPEQCSGKEVTAKSDQYSLGVMCYQMLTGILPFDGETVPEIISKHFFEEATPLVEVLPDLEPKFAEAVHRSLEKKPEDRFDSLDEFVQAVSQAIAVGTADHPDEEVRTQMIELSRPSGSFGQAKVVTPPTPIPADKLGRSQEDDRKSMAELATTPMPAQPAEPKEEMADAATVKTPVPPAADLPTTPTPKVPPPPEMEETPLPTAKPRPKKSRKMVGIAAGIIGLIGIGGGVAVVMSGSDESTPPGDPVAQVEEADGPAQPDGGQPAQVTDTTGGEATDQTDSPDTQQPASRQQEPEAEPEPTPTPPRPTTGTIRVSGGPGGLSITVDGRSASRTGTYQEGRHTVRLSAPGYQTLTRTVTVQPEGTSTVNANQMQRTPEPEPPPQVEVPPPNSAQLFITGNRIPGLRIIVNGREVDSDGGFIPAGDLQIVFQATGYDKPAIRPVTVEAGREVRIPARVVVGLLRRANR